MRVKPRDRFPRAFAWFVSVAVLLATVPQVAPQEVSPALLQAVEEAYQQQQQEEPQILPRIAPTQKPLQGVSLSAWDALYQLQVGDRVLCRTRDGISHRGRFRAFSSESITLKIGRREVGFRREQVVSVRRRGRGHRGRTALLGAVVGFGSMAWAVTGEGVGLFLVGGMVFGGVGAAVGAGVGWPAETTIYRANP